MKKYIIKNMMCNNCYKKIKKTLDKTIESNNYELNLDTKTLLIKDDVINIDNIILDIKNLGFIVDEN